MMIDLDDLSVDGKPISDMDAKVRIFIPTDNIPDEPIHYGDSLKFFAALECYPPKDYPHGLDFRRQQRRDWIVFRTIAEEKPEVLDRPVTLTNGFYRLMGSLRRQLRTEIVSARASVDIGAPMALLLGNRQFLSDKLRFTFQRAGISHLFAVSGFHLGILIGLIWSISRLVIWLHPGLLRQYGETPLSLCGSLIVSACFLIVVGMPVSATRAWLAVAVAGLRFQLGRRIGGLHLLSAVALIVLMADPRAIFDMAFQLSFGATVGMVIFWDYHRRRLSEDVAAIERQIYQFVGMTAAANVATWPILVAHTGQAPVGSLLLNLVVIPIFMSVVFPGVIIGTLLLFATGSMFVLSFAAGGTQLSKRLADVGIGVDWYLWTPGIQPPLWVLGLTLAALLFLTSALRVRVLSVCAALTGCLLVYSGGYVTDQTDNILQIDSLPVGQGDSTLIKSPEGEVGLIDAGGSRFGTDPGRWNVVPFMFRQGIERLDWVIASHADIDHIGGLGAVVKWLRVKRIYYPAVHHSTVMAKLLERARRWNHLSLNPVVPGHRFEASDSVRGEAPGPIAGKYGDNNQSLVVRARQGPFDGLFPGDIEKGVERKLVRSGIDAADFLKAPHHGSDTSSSPEFLKALRPRWTVFSVGRDNRFGHPDEDVLSRYRQIRAGVYRTDRHGLIRFRVDTDGRVEISTLRR
jgi:competence protein ComEC